MTNDIPEFNPPRHLPPIAELAGFFSCDGLDITTTAVAVADNTVHLDVVLYDPATGSFVWGGRYKVVGTEDVALASTRAVQKLMVAFTTTVLNIRAGRTSNGDDAVMQWFHGPSGQAFLSRTDSVVAQRHTTG